MPALLVMDMQERLLRGRPWLLPRVNSLIERACATHALVVYVRNIPRGGPLDARLLTGRGPEFEKYLPSALTNPKLRAYLCEQAVDSVVVCGLFAEACVRATAAACRKQGYEVTIAADAIGSQHPLAMRWAMGRFLKAGARLAPADDLFDRDGAGGKHGTVHMDGPAAQHQGQV